MHLLITAGFMLALMAAPSDADAQNTPPKDDNETLCVPNRAPQRGTRRDGSRRPTVQCNLVKLERERERERRRQLGDLDTKPVAPIFTMLEKVSGTPQ
jgi:hypothetical protein